MQLSEILANLQALGYDTDTEAQQIIFINDTYREVNGKQRWPWHEKFDNSLSTSYNQNIYSLASLTDLRSIDAVRLEQTAFQNYLNLDYTEPQEMRRHEHMDRLPAPPSKWSIIDENLHLWPYPDGTYTIDIDYIITPPELLLPTDTSVWPDDYDDILVWGAVRSIAYRERDWLGRNFAQQEFETRLIRMQQEVQVRQRQTDSHVKRGHWIQSAPLPWYPYGW